MKIEANTAEQLEKQSKKYIQQRKRTKRMKKSKGKMKRSKSNSKKKKRGNNNGLNGMLHKANLDPDPDLRKNGSRTFRKSGSYTKIHCMMI